MSDQAPPLNITAAAIQTAEGIARGLPALALAVASAAGKPVPRSSLALLAAQLADMASDAADLAEVLDGWAGQAARLAGLTPDEGEPPPPPPLDEAEPPPPPPLDWPGIKARADGEARHRFRAGIVELAVLDHAAALLAHGAQAAVDHQPADGAARRQAAEAVAEAHALLRQAVAQMRALAAGLARAEELRPDQLPTSLQDSRAIWAGSAQGSPREHSARYRKPSDSREAKGKQALDMRWLALAGAADFARSFADMPGEPFEALLRLLPDDDAVLHGRQPNAAPPFAFATAKAYSVCAMVARSHARRLEGGRRGDAPPQDARAVARAWAGNQVEEKTLREWARKHRPWLGRVAAGKPEGDAPIKGEAAERLRFFARNVLAPGAARHPDSVEGWQRVAEAYELAIRRLTKASGVARAARREARVNTPRGFTPSAKAS